MLALLFVYCLTVAYDRGMMQVVPAIFSLIVFELFVASAKYAVPLTFAPVSVPPHKLASSVFDFNVCSAPLETAVEVPYESIQTGTLYSVVMLSPAPVYSLPSALITPVPFGVRSMSPFVTVLSDIDVSRRR